ncbi:ZIP family metal transporter [Patescibacteria group bacterium]|nr:ZIP family metal transporter [Patescibacteria group bacterium]
MEAVLFSLLTFISTSLGGLFGIKNKDKLHYIMSFTAGVLLGVSFFDIIPEAFRIISENRFDVNLLTIPLIFGFLIFHTLEKTILIHHSHEVEYADHKHPHIGLTGALGLAFHSFLDGVGIGLGFHVNNHIGILVAIAVISHDFSDGLNTVTLMLTHKNSTKKTIYLLLLDASAPILGTLSTFLFSVPEKMLVIYLGFFTGFLLYISASDLLPEAHSKHSSYRLIILTMIGLAFIFLVTRFA